MKLFSGVAVALAGCLAAAQQAAPVYIIPDPEASSSPSISQSLARLILLQRLSPLGSGPPTHEIPSDSDFDEAVSVLIQFGKASPSLLGNADVTAPRQLVVVLEGLSADQIKDLGHGFAMMPAFTIKNPPSSSANKRFFQHEVYEPRLAQEHACSLSAMANPLDDACWSGKSAVAEYNVQEDPASFNQLRSKLGQLSKLAKQGEMETTIVLVPASAESSGPSSWSDSRQELRRRQMSQPMPDQDTVAGAAGATSSQITKQQSFASVGPIPSCFGSEDACTSATGNCSGHGLCQNKYANSDGSNGSNVCYTCHCLSTVGESGGYTHWAGSVCSKKDVSTQFWLFAGFTIVMVGILSLSIGMLFNVGEEKLPGVIGAGVSRSK